MLLPLILSAIVSLLEFFFERWWVANHGCGANKNDFLLQVGSVKHFWMGKRRVEYASKLFDKFVERFNADPAKFVEYRPFTKTEARLLAAKYGDGLTLTDAERGLCSLGSGERRFNILPNGLVQGGSASYSLNELTGAISYQASIRVGKWFLSKTYYSSGNYQVSTQLLNSSSLTVGKVITVGDLQMRVMSTGQYSALVSISILGQNTAGTAILLTSQPSIVLNSLDATVPVLGMRIVIGLRAE